MSDFKQWWRFSEIFCLSAADRLAMGSAAESAWDHQQKRIDNLEAAVTKTDDDACQVLGKVLKYPWYKDDLEVFPNATEKMGVCVGDHVALSMAMEAAKRIDELEAENRLSCVAMARASDTVIAQTNRIDELEAKVKKLARLERIAIKWHKNNGRFENHLYAAIEELMQEVIEDE